MVKRATFIKVAGSLGWRRGTPPRTQGKAEAGGGQDAPPPAGCFFNPKSGPTPQP